MQAGELSDLEPGLEISFTTCEDVQSKLQEHVGRSPHNPWVFIHDITLESFHHLNDSFDTYSRSDYYHDLQLAVLYLKLASHQHSWALTHFKRLMNAKLWSAGISDFQFTWMMNKRFSGFRREKEPDDTFFPSLYVPHDAWPVLVIEVGVSETIPQLQRDAIWWFRQWLDIKYVLLISFDQSQRTIRIEKWESNHTALPAPAPSQIVTTSANGVYGSLSLSVDSLFGSTGSGLNITFGPELAGLWAP